MSNLILFCPYSDDAISKLLIRVYTVWFPYYEAWNREKYSEMIKVGKEVPSRSKDWEGA